MTLPTPEKNRTNLIAVVAIALVLVVGGVIAVVVATTSGGGDDATTTTTTPQKSPAAAADTRLAAERDAALADGSEAVEILNTVDHENVEEDLNRWASVATGELLADLEENRAQYVSQVGNARSTTTAAVLDAALTDLDEEAGTARLMAALSVDVTIEGQEPSNRRTRLTADLERTDDGWKVSRVGTL